MGGETKLESMLDAEILGIANPIMGNLMDASNAIDHERHICGFTARMKSIVTKEYLQRVWSILSGRKGSFPSVSQSSLGRILPVCADNLRSDRG